MHESILIRNIFTGTVQKAVNCVHSSIDTAERKANTFMEQRLGKSAVNAEGSIGGKNQMAYRKHRKEHRKRHHKSAKHHAHRKHSKRRY